MAAICKTTVIRACATLSITEREQSVGTLEVGCCWEVNLVILVVSDLDWLLSLDSSIVPIYVGYVQVKALANGSCGWGDQKNFSRVSKWNEVLKYALANWSLRAPDINIDWTICTIGAHWKYDRLRLIFRHIDECEGLSLARLVIVSSTLVHSELGLSLWNTHLALSPFPLGWFNRWKCLSGKLILVDCSEPCLEIWFTLWYSIRQSR